MADLVPQMLTPIMAGNNSARLARDTISRELIKSAHHVGARAARQASIVDEDMDGAELGLHCVEECS
jgi:hypothetical protein